MPDEQYPELLENIRADIAEALIEIGIDEEVAKHAGHHAAETVRCKWGGTQMPYIPKGVQYQASLRDRQIWQEFNGQNHNELCRKYGISLQWLYSIIKRMRADYVRRHQADLFDTGGDK